MGSDENHFNSLTRPILLSLAFRNFFSLALQDAFESECSCSAPPALPSVRPELVYHVPQSAVTKQHLTALSRKAHAQTMPTPNSSTGLRHPSFKEKGAGKRCSECVPTPAPMTICVRVRVCATVKPSQAKPHNLPPPPAELICHKSSKRHHHVTIASHFHQTLTSLKLKPPAINSTSVSGAKFLNTSTSGHLFQPLPL